MATYEDIQKANALIKIWNSELSLGELKILDIYLGRINMKEPDRKHLRFTKKELEDLLNVTRIKPDRLSEMLKHLFASYVNVEAYDEDSDCLTSIQMHLFDTCTTILNRRTGEMEIDLECSEKAGKFIFNIERLGYTRFALLPALRIRSRYGYTLYQYLLQNAFRKTWTVPLEEVKEIVRCPGSGKNDYYDSYKYFNRDILQRCHKEITDMTDLRYEYEPVKDGRCVTEIRFTILNQEELKKLSGTDEDSESGLLLPEADMAFSIAPDPYLEHISLLQSACMDMKNGSCVFSNEEMEAISGVLDRVPDVLLPHVPGMPPGNMAIRQYHYLREKYLLMKAKDSKTRITHKSDYIIKMIENDIAEFISD